MTKRKKARITRMTRLNGEVYLILIMIGGFIAILMTANAIAVFSK